MNRLSFVVTGRNDNYDGNFDDRLAVALTKNIRSFPEAEFIFVEWNPYMNRELTSHKLQKIFDKRVKYFVVHPKYHNKYCTIDGFLEYPAKNVGIRRAAGAFIGCINSDIVFCPDLVDKLKGELKNNILYRATRIDIKPDNLDISFPLRNDIKLETNYGPTNAAGDFLLMHKDLWALATGYCEEFPAQRLHKDAFIVYLLADKKKLPIINIGSITHWRHPSSWSNGFCRGKVGDIRWDYKVSGFEKNKDTWGLTFAKETKKDGLIWLE